MTNPGNLANKATMKAAYCKPECQVFITEAEEMLCSSTSDDRLDPTINDYIDDETYTETLSLF